MWPRNVETQAPFVTQEFRRNHVVISQESVQFYRKTKKQKGSLSCYTENGPSERLLLSSLLKFAADCSRADKHRRHIYDLGETIGPTQRGANMLIVHCQYHSRYGQKGCTLVKRADRFGERKRENVCGENRCHFASHSERRRER
jgi:hypothetical protein